MIANKFILAGFLAATAIVYLVFIYPQLNDQRNTFQRPKPAQRRLAQDLNIVNSKNISDYVETTTVKVNPPHLHSDLNDRNLTLINIPNFKFIINNDICNVDRIALVSIIHSAADNKPARSMIRESWGNPSFPDIATRLVFLLGSTPDTGLQASIQEESDKFGDIIQGDFVDTYHNLSYKAVMGNLWVSEFCEQAEFVVKTDDDMYVDLYEVYALTRRYLTSQHYIRNRGLPILRDKNSKWYASYEDVPKIGKPGSESYPTDCSGWLWITSPGTSKAISEAAQVVKFFWIDDVWVSGYIAQHLKIEHQDCIQYWTMKAEQLLLYKSIQRPDNYCPDYMSGPMNRDQGLNQALHRRATWCYLNNCQNNIYQEHAPTKISELTFSNMIKHYFPF